MSITDKYYNDVDQDLIDTTIKTIKDTLKFACEKYYLTERDINALARTLAYHKKINDDDAMYAHVVDFLWMAYHIGFNQKMMLLDLLND